MSVEKAALHLGALRDLFLMTPTTEEMDALGASDAARFMADRNIANVVLTRGAAGTRLYQGGRVADFAPRNVVQSRGYHGGG